MSPGTPDGIHPIDSILVQAGNFMLGAAGDIDGDGYGDVIASVSEPVGVPELERVYFGGPGSCGATDCRRSSPITIPQHNRTGGNSLAIIAAAGDVDGDGTDDLVVAAPDDITVYLFLGTADGLSRFPLRTWTAPGNFATSVAGLFGTARPTL